MSFFKILQLLLVSRSDANLSNGEFYFSANNRLMVVIKTMGIRLTIPISGCNFKRVLDYFLSRTKLYTV